MPKKPKELGPDYKRSGYEQKRKIKSFLLLNLGVIIVSLGIHFFKYPNHFALGGVSGISVVLAALVPAWTPAVSALVINAALLVLALVIFGKSFAGKTLYASGLMSILLVIFEKVIPQTEPITNESFMELIIAILLSALGSAILFNLDASSGGTDIIAMIIKKYTNADIGRALLISDITIALATFFIFDPQTGLLSTLGVLTKGIVVDSLIRNFNLVKFFTIVTTEPDAVGDLVTKTLQRSCTRLEGKGQYTGNPVTVFICAVDLRQSYYLREAVKKIDPSAFVMINESSEVSGRGFRTGF
ncbi:MAG: YitT family protein [Eubacteriales bacterium]|nr:YitT family protein [Eubacteriales bacterium]